MAFAAMPQVSLESVGYAKIPPFRAKASWLRNFTPTLLTALGLLVVCLNPAYANENAAARSLDVDAIDLATGVELPNDYLQALQEQVVKDLTDKKTFNSVHQHSSEAQDNSDLELKCTVTRFVPGSRAKRIVATGIGRMAGVGATRITVRVSLRDNATQQVVLDRDLEGAQKGTSMNPADAFSSSKGVVSIAAKKIADEIVKSVNDSNKRK